MSAPDRVALLPRMGPLAADRALAGLDAGDVPEGSAKLPPGAGYAEVGGSPVSTHELEALRDAVLEAARACGFPASRGREAAARFDVATAILLADSPLFDSPEALRDDVWTYVSTALLGDVTHWRFGSTRARYLGGVRNCFQRLWMRARTLDRGEDHPERHGLLGALGEDAHVAIAERPAIGSDPVLARALAEGWVRAAQRFGAGAMEPLMRRATMRIRMLNETRELSMLPSWMRDELVDAEFERAAAVGSPTGVRDAA